MTNSDRPLRTLLVDNYDSFTYNLAHYLRECSRADVLVIHNDDSQWRQEFLSVFDSIVLSPGPGTPEREGDFGICADLLRTAEVPLLGVCLGHQGLCHAFGGVVTPAPEPVHGRTSALWHDGSDLFAGIPSPFLAVRYHSLIASEIPEPLKVTAWTDAGLPMALRHRHRQLFGVQFHPESICTEHGHALLANFQALALQCRCSRHRRTSGIEWDDVRRALAPRRAADTPGNGVSAGSAPADTADTAEPTHRVLVRPLTGDLDPEAVFSALYRGSTNAFWLDSSLLADGPKCSMMGDSRGPLARTATVDVRRSEITITSAAGRDVRHGNFFDWLRDDLRNWRVETPPLPFDFALGWVGALGYELKAHATGEPAHLSDLPDAYLVFTDRAIVFEHDTGITYLLALAPSGDEDAAREWMDAVEHQLAGGIAEAPYEPGSPKLGRARLRHNRTSYLELIEEAQREICAGESYEVCLTNMVEVVGTIDPWIAYQTLRRQNKVPFGAYLRFDDVAVLCCSPERMLRVDAFGNAESKPIKGTRPRGDDAAEDELLRLDLATSVKDRAENLMIVDLTRNDLGSVSEVGSVAVSHLFAIDTYSTVHQMVSTVRSTLPAGAHAVDCLRTLFPGGSMTGAPKIRTMQIIDRLEQGPRGLYSGGLGYFSLTGALDVSITIRTLVAKPGLLRFGVGGAITSLSDPAQEFDETAVKAAALLRLIDQEFPERTPVQWLDPDAVANRAP